MMCAHHRTARALATTLYLGGCAGAADSQSLTYQPEPSLCLEVGPGPEDFATLAQPDGTTRVFASIKTRGLSAGEDDGRIAEIRLDGAARPIGDPKPVAEDGPGGRRLHPVGLSLTEGDDGPRLYVVDSAGDTATGGARIVAFDVVPDGLARDGTAISLDDDLLPTANDLLALPDGHIYISNPVQPFFNPMVWLRYWRGEWPALVHLRPPESDGSRTAEIPADDLSFANGIAADPTHDRLFVANYSGGEVVVFDRDPSDGSLERRCAIPIDGSPDNLMTEGTTLYVAAQHSLLRSFCHLVAPELCGSPSHALAIRLDAGNPCEAVAMPVWDDGGAYVAAGSTAAPVGGSLLVSQIVRPGIYVFDRAGTGSPPTPATCTADLSP